MEFSRHEVGQIKKPQTAHRIDYGLVHENPWLIILTSIELVQENSQDIQILIKKAPLDPNNGGTAGFTFINADYHVAPVLPPKVECSCLAAMDAYASLLSVQSKTPTPGAPVTLDPEVLNTGSSKIVATLRMYHGISF